MERERERERGRERGGRAFDATSVTVSGAARNFIDDYI